jgi:hypothetical protein
VPGTKLKWRIHSASVRHENPVGLCIIDHMTDADMPIEKSMVTTFQHVSSWHLHEILGQKDRMTARRP